jgi:hypothetical protein
MQWLALEIFREDDAFDRIPTSQVFAREPIGDDVCARRAIQPR